MGRCGHMHMSVDGHMQATINKPASQQYEWCRLPTKTYWKEDSQERREKKGSAFLVSQIMAFFQSAVGSLQTIVVALGAGLGVWGAINLLEGYGNDNPGAKSQGMKHVIPSLMEQ